MQIKAADDKQPLIDALAVVRTRPDVDERTGHRIDEEVRNIRAGAKAEKDAAYEIEFHFGKSRNISTIHDLRVECDGRVAQIDHLIVNRLLHVWVCESKSVSEGIGVNELGEWVTFHSGRARGIASPIEQNKKHIVVLQDLFRSGLLKLPTRLGVTLSPHSTAWSSCRTRGGSRAPGVRHGWRASTAWSRWISWRV